MRRMGGGELGPDRDRGLHHESVLVRGWESRSRDQLAQPEKNNENLRDNERVRQASRRGRIANRRSKARPLPQRRAPATGRRGGDDLLLLNRVAQRASAKL